MGEMERSIWIKPFEQFKTNYITLLEFYMEFSSHFKKERENSETSLNVFRLIKWFLKSFLELLGSVNMDDKVASKLFKILGIPETAFEDISKFDSISIRRNILKEMGLPLDKMESFNPTFMEEFWNSKTSNNDANFDPAEVLNLAFRSGFKAVGLDLGTNISEIETNFLKKLQEATSESFETEKRLLIRLWSVCIIQLYTILENFLRDIVIAIASDDPIAFFSAPDFNDSKVPYRNHILNAATKEEIIEKAIEDSADNYQKWYHAEKLFNSKKMTIFPANQALKDREQEVWKEDLKVDDDLMVKEKLQKFQLYRNALVHNEGEIREKDLKNAKVRFIQPHKVILNENYVRHSFILNSSIVRQICSQLIKSPLGDKVL